MQHHQGSRRDPLLIQFDRHSELSTLHEAKLAAWAFAIGEGASTARRVRRLHRGMLPDVLPPDKPPGARRPSLLKRLAQAAAGLFVAVEAPAAPVTALSAEAEGGAGEGAASTYKGRTNAEEAAGIHAAKIQQPIGLRAA